MLSDIEIAQQSKLSSITKIAEKLGISSESIELFGNDKAKVSLKEEDKASLGKLILVTSINPTPAGEGKTTVSIGLADRLNQLHKNAVLALREPSLGPVMGLKGGATGGGYSQVLPMEDINLHFTGDIHAITTANNALSAFIDNHIHQGNELGIDPQQIIWKRSLDLNDRALRNTLVGLGNKAQGVPRQEGFDITVASEIMAILCLASALSDLKARLARIVIGYTYQNEPVTVQDLQVEGALALLLKEAMKPNLVQTIEQTPAFIHGGPFANIAHGCNSVVATKTALRLADYVVTEAGFGADLGAEKFLDIKVPNLEKSPDAVVMVATVRALKMHGGVAVDQLDKENLPALEKGFANLKKHIQNMQSFGLPVVVAINEFAFDQESELSLLQTLCQEIEVNALRSSTWANGGMGAKELASTVVDTIADKKAKYTPLYQNQLAVEDKIKKIARNIYGAKNVFFEKNARKQLEDIKTLGWDQLPVCIAKTQYSLSDDASLLGVPKEFDLTVREISPKIGAGFLVVLTGNVLTMPGLPKRPTALDMDVDEKGNASGLF
ncbi:formate--tetrahydrofolate ligase [Tetragenococcus halophilus subsp. halophilus]|uniref:formate--tetrahydrofolate ligase n=1 Tax=Tetragenococcus halophilus TaxID=51669 RepID=UPI000CB8B48B|nr:formate--tetrahydrofolate ligase [Tetragenococcus halophilus]GBD71922.1 formate--tetrahydrofolate ligase [Tetragenococcus halophilus subsp. halophilus]GBD74956.1 formate--tetrahydrofolate ligase [Tetragenococcus halophilus subsp. halophilus]